VKDLLSTNHLDATVDNDVQLVYAPSFNAGTARRVRRSPAW